jgi:hypothetical protein
MVNNISAEKDKYVNLSNIASLISFSLFIAVIFSLLRYHFYFQVLLHVPIFQFIDASELVLMTAGTGITWIFYLGANSLANFIRKEDDFTGFQKWVFQLIILSIGLLYLWINYFNDPIIREFIKWPWHYKYWHIYFTTLILFVIAYSYKGSKGQIFFEKNKLIIPLLLTLWYALFEGWANYEVVTKSEHTNNITVQTKSMGVIKTDSIIVNAGRTKSYWFFYNRNTHITRAIKTEDIEFVDFDADNK